MTNPAPTIVSQVKPMAAIYLRVSTKDQAERGGEVEGFSIPAQREACYRKAEAMGVQVVAEFVDAGESARSANRPELQKMLTYVADHRVGFLIVHKVDRLARNRVDDVEINLQLQAAGAQLVSVSENIDETPSGMLLHGIMSSIAEFYSRNLATEAKKGMLQKAKNGGTPGRAPFGYRNTRTVDEMGREARTVEIDADRAHWVRWMFERYATGEWTVPMMVDELRDLGLTTAPTPKKPAAALGRSQINAMLMNHYYVGIVTFDGVEYNGKHPALVSEELFAKVQAVRQGRSSSREKPRVHTHYLRGTVACGQCGELLAFEKSRGRLGNYYEYFYCMGRQKDKNGCTFRAVQVHVVEDLVQDHWSGYTLAESHVAEVRRLVLSHLDEMLPNQHKERGAAMQQLRVLEDQSAKLLQAHYADAIDLHQLKREQARIATQRAMHEQTLTRQQVTEESLRRKIEDVCGLLSNAHQHYLQADDLGRRDLNQGVFRRIYIDDDEVVGADLTPAFYRLLSDSLQDDLATERNRHLNRRVRTSDHLYLTEVTQARIDDIPARCGDIHRRTVESVSIGQFTPRQSIERPRPCW